MVNGIPPHKGGVEEPQPFSITASWPAGTFVENIFVATDGTIYCTAHPNTLYRVRDGQVDSFASLPDAPNGIAIDAEGTIWLNGGLDLSQPKPNVIWRLNQDGLAEEWALIEEATFLNGMALHPDGRILTVDSRSGGVYAIDPKRKGWSLWYRCDDLMPQPDVHGPGANGIKVFGNSAYVSVTNKATLVRIPLDEAGNASRHEIFAENLIVDDFAIDADGTFYLTTHPVNTLVALSADGRHRKTIAGPEQGMVGATACAFGMREGDKTGLYVTTDGGMIAQYGDALQPAKLVRLETAGVVLG